jgi:hypothetical protein
MKSRSGYNLILNAFVIIALIALMVQWIWLEKKPDGLDGLLQNEASYWWQINENTLNDFKNRIESIQPQYKKIGRAYYAHFVTVSKALDSSRTIFQKAISSGRNKDSVSHQVESAGKLFDSIFDQYLLLRKKFSPDSIKDESPYLKEQIQEYSKDTEEGKAWISDFKNEIRKQDWSNGLIELQPLMLYDLEGQYIDFMTSNYAMLTDRYFDHYVYMAQGPVIASPKLKRGSLAFNPPGKMGLFKKERIKVLISKHYFPNQTAIR